MASVEELLAKYGKNDAGNANENTQEETDTSTTYTKYEEIQEPSTIDNFPARDDESTGSTLITFGNEDEAVENQDTTSHPAEQGVTNKDGRRLIADAYYNEEPRNTEVFERVPEITPAATGFNFEEDEDDFEFTQPANYDYQETTPVTNTDVEYQNQYYQESEKEETPEPYPTFSDNDIETGYVAYPENVAYETDNEQYPQVYVDPTASQPNEQVSTETTVVTTSQNPPVQDSQQELANLANKLTVLMPAPAETHAGIAAFSTFMFPPFGAVAVHHAMRTFTTAYNGEKEESISHSSKALAWSVAAIIAGSLLLALLGLYKYDSTIFDALFNRVGLLNN